MCGYSLLAATGLAMLLGAAPAPVRWSFTATELADGRVRLDLAAEIEKGWHVYATRLPSDLGPLPTTVTFVSNAAYEPVDGVLEPEPEKANDPNFGMVLHFHSERVVFAQVIARRSSEAFSVQGEVEYMACNDQMCLPPVRVPFTIDVPARSK